MNKIKSNYWYLLLLVLGGLFFSGCWNYREISQLAVVSGISVDYGEKSGTVELTVQIVKTGDLKSKEGQSKSPFIVKSNTGRTIPEAINKFFLDTNRQLFFPHNQVIIFGKEQARKGVDPRIDYLIRNIELRPLIWILVSRTKGSDVLKIPGSLENVPAMEIRDLVDTQALASQNVMTNLQQFTIGLLDKNTATVAPFIDTQKANGKKIFKINGTAVFKNGRLCGELNNKQTRGLLWVKGKVQNGIIVIKVPGGHAGLAIKKSNCEIKSVIDKTKIKLKIKIRMESHLDSQTGPLDLTKPKILKKLEEKQNIAVCNEVYAAFKKAKSLKADIFEFGGIIHRQHPKLWRKIEANWDTEFSQLEIEVKVDSVIRLTGLAFPPPR